MPIETEALIEQLAREALPVRRLRPPMTRASLCVGAIFVAMAIAILGFANFHVFAIRAAQSWLEVELVGTITTGVLATIAAFHLSLPDRSPRWALLPLPSLALWLSGSGLGCLRHFLSGTGDDWQLRQSLHCVFFICGIGIPLSAALLWQLGRARPLAPLPVNVTGGLAAAAFAAFLLEFFHPFEISLMDLILHAFAVGIVVLIAGIRGPSLIRRSAV